MPRKKLRKLRGVDSLPNVFGPESEKGVAEMFHYLPPEQPLTLEIGCGRGDYTIKLARRYAGRNFVGIDVKGARLWTAARWAEREALPNAAFLRAPAQSLPVLFPAASVEEIWLPFPDPFPKKRNTKWRVTSASFLDAYRHVLQPGGRVHLKTDDPAFFAYTLHAIEQMGIKAYEQCEDVYAANLAGSVTEIQTLYEERHLAEGKQIRYLSFGFDGKDRAA